MDKTLADIYGYYNGDYEWDMCETGRNIINPSLCEAGREYRRQMKGFIRDTLNESRQDTLQNKEPQLIEAEENNLNQKYYPLVNYNFNYENYVKKNYNPYALNITNEPSMKAIRTGIVKLDAYDDALFKTGLPDESTIAGKSDIINEDKRATEIADTYRAMSQNLPYPTFRKDYPECTYPIDGKHSSSYFVRSGICPTKITNEEECKRKGYEWAKNTGGVADMLKDFTKQSTRVADEEEKIPSGRCFKPRFMYIDNSPKGSKGMKGMVSSIFDDIMSISPDKLSAILSGYSVEGTGLLPCIEEFNNQSSLVSFITLVVILLLLIFIYYLNRK